MTPDSELARTTMRRVSVRLLPFLTTLYLFNTMDPRKLVGTSVSTASAKRLPPLESTMIRTIRARMGDSSADAMMRQTAY